MTASCRYCSGILICIVDYAYYPAHTALAKIKVYMGFAMQVLNGDFTCPPGRPEGLTNLTGSMLKVSPASRPDIDTVLRRLQCFTSEQASRAPAADRKPPGTTHIPLAGAQQGEKSCDHAQEQPRRAVSAAGRYMLKTAPVQHMLTEIACAGIKAQLHTSPQPPSPPPPPSGAWDMGGWDLNAWEAPSTSVPSSQPANSSQVGSFLWMRQSTPDDSCPENVTVHGAAHSMLHDLCLCRLEHHVVVRRS